MGVLGGVFVLKSGLRILIRTPEVPFSVPPKMLKMGHFGCFWLNMSESEKLFFPQLLYTIRQLKNFGFIDKSHFCAFQLTLVTSAVIGSL